MWLDLAIRKYREWEKSITTLSPPFDRPANPDDINFFTKLRRYSEDNLYRDSRLEAHYDSLFKRKRYATV